MLLAAPLLAQTFTGAISGRVADATGSVIPNVQVTITETSTNTVSKTITNEVGDYIVSFLRPGPYRVSFTAPCFKEYVESGLALQINQQLRVDAAMQVGEVTEKLEVSASAVQLNFTSSEVGHVVSAEQLLNLPLIASNSRGRSPLLWAKLLPGVTSTSANNSNINNFSFGGGRPVTNEILVDGLPTTNPSDQTYTLTPSPDAVQEFKVLTTPFSAEYGHTGGGVMMLTSKTGTNQYHGSAYDYFRNRLLNGRNFFAPAKSTIKYVQNDPGGTFGGPMRLPGYNGHDKTFFFADFNVTLASNGNLYNQMVPTAAEKSGDFTQSVNNQGRQVQIYDPNTTRANPAGAGYIRDLFPGNRIPQARLDSVASQIVKFYPEPNGQYAGGLNYSVHPPQIRQTWQWLTRFDHNFSSDDKAFFRIGGYNPNGEMQQRILNKANNDTQGGFRDTQIVMGETHVFGPRLINDFRVGFAQEVNYSIGGAEPAPELGLKGVSLDSFPVIAVAQMIQLGANPSNRDRNRSYVFNEAMTFQNGRHTLKMGGDYRRQMYNYYNPGKLAGNYSFGPAFSALPGSAVTGYGLADLLLGLPSSTNIRLEDYTYRLNINSSGMYLQDDYKITSKLTLNLGVRWEYNGPYSEANNQFASLNPLVTNKTTGTPGEVEFAGRDGAPVHFAQNIYRSFLPRVGFAWNLAPRTVFRGGYGIYRLPSIGFADWWPVSQYTVNATFASLDNNITAPFQLASGVPRYTYNVNAAGLPNIPASLTAPSQTVRQLETRDRTPYNQTWQFGLQRQVSENWLGEVDYVATKGTKLPIGLFTNQLRPEQFSARPSILQRPFPQYLAVAALRNDGNSTYHSLQAKLEHRWKNGLHATMAYTFSKLINDVDAPARSNGAPVQNIYNLRAERGVAGYDVPQRLVSNVVWNVPIGRGGKYLSEVPVVKEILGGWQMSGLAEFQVGLPMQVTQQQNNTGGFTQTQRPNQVAAAALPHFDRNINRWFNTDAFVPAAALTLGNASRFPLHGPGINNWDFALTRMFRYRERLWTQFRAEFYNAMNHPNFNGPNTQIANRNYGIITGARDARVVEFVLRFLF
ncbi:MAG: TonB-dependent receptor [Acidobacteria bacterium]|nr:TonB-dependent receptor [Acidobacteriota bacterium]